jgi:hypothetical protein
MLKNNEGDIAFLVPSINSVIAVRGPLEVFNWQFRNSTPNSDHFQYVVILFIIVLHSYNIRSFRIVAHQNGLDYCLTWGSGPTAQLSICDPNFAIQTWQFSKGTYTVYNGKTS